MGIFGHGAEDRFGAGKDCAVGLDELNRRLKLFVGNLRKAGGDLWVLGWQVVYGIAGQLPPAANPKAAKITVTVENHERFWRRRGDMNTAFHSLTLNQPGRERQ